MKEAIKKYLEETMVLVEGGEFMMGGNRDEDEKPIHRVDLLSFWINKYPVTQELYKWVMRKNPSRFIGEERPVEKVSWYDAIEFCNALSKEMGIENIYYSIEREINESGDKNRMNVVINENSKGYRLPTEAEWEYAARGGKYREIRHEFSGGNNMIEVGWCLENSHRETKPVGLKEPNQLGLYDMSGNVFELCWDRYGKYKKETELSPIGAKIGNKRVARGGSWFKFDNYSRVAYRFNSNPNIRSYAFGFRISKTT